MNARIKPSKEECASRMVQRSNDAVAKGALIELSKEECVLDMGQRSNDAAAKDVLINPSVTEYAAGMEQINCAATMDVQTKPSKEEYAGDMGQTAMQKMNLLLLEQNKRRILTETQTLPNHHFGGSHSPQ
jgi:hypothetical protein